MKKFLSVALLSLLAFSSFANDHKDLPEYVIMARPTEFRGWLIPDYVVNAVAVNSYDIGIKYNTAVWTSVQVNDSTYDLSGLRVDADGKMEFKFWSDHIICTGSGSCGLTSTAGYVRNDRALIVAGTYTSGFFSRFHFPMSFIPQTVRPTFTGELGFRSMDSVELAFINFLGISNSAMDIRAYEYNPLTANPDNLPIRNCYLHNLSFKNVTGAVIDANGGIRHIVGNDSTYEWLNNTFDSITLLSCGHFAQGAFGQGSDNGGQPAAVWRGTKVYHLVDEATTATGEEGMLMRGIQLECDYGWWTITSTTQRGPSGDLGAIYGHFNGILHDLYKNGGPGYLIRASPCREIGRPGAIRGWNIIGVNKTEYGTIQHQDPDTAAGLWGCVDSVSYYNVTGGNQGEQINYWSPVVVLGQRGWCRYQFRNIFGFNNNTNAKPEKIIYNQGSFWPTESADTSNTAYYNSATIAGLDTSHVIYISNTLGNFYTYAPTSSSPALLKTGGITSPLSSTDFAGAAYNQVIGYRAVLGSPSANAGTDQTITLPTNSVSLSASGSTGTITSYLWTQVSGPGGATITSPISVGTTVTGLVQGTYIFQISLNSGASTDQVQIIVNPAPCAGCANTMPGFKYAKKLP